jgi:hypothetical protein
MGWMVNYWKCSYSSDLKRGKFIVLLRGNTISEIRINKIGIYFHVDDSIAGFEMTIPTNRKDFHSKREFRMDRR